MFDAQIILVGVWRFEMRVNNRRASIEACESAEGVQEIYVVVQRLAKRIGGAGRAKRIAKESVSGRSCCRHIGFVNANVGGCGERSLPVELEVVFGL